MAKSAPPDRLDELLAVVAERADGRSAAEIAGALNPKAPLRNVQRWLARLVRENKLVRTGRTNTTRYLVAGPLDENGGDGSHHTSGMRKSRVAQAIEVLISRPLAERPPIDYHRAWVDAYDAGRTFYVPERVREQLSAMAGGEVSAALMRVPTTWEGFTADVVASVLDLEGVSISDADLAQALAQPASDAAVSQPIRLAWNIRTVVDRFVRKGDKFGLDIDSVFAIAEVLFDGIVPNDMADGTPKENPLRFAPLALPLTRYRPPADPAMIRTCFGDVIGVALEINDPIERAFFTFAHLLYLMPFEALNVSTICLVTNMAVVHAKLFPIPFINVSRRDLMAGVLGVWELNRTELLRDVFVRSYWDGLGVPPNDPRRAQ